MSCKSRELTIEDVLADPVIGAAMKADRVDPCRFEMFLRVTARRLDAAPRALYHPALAGMTAAAARGCASAGATAW